MAIQFDVTTGIFSLETNGSTYQMQADRHGCLLHLYYGAPINGPADYLLTFYDRGFSGNPYDAGTDRTYSLDALPQEFPVWGTGDYRSTCLTVKRPDGSCGCDLRYKSHSIRSGKYDLPGLPAVYDTAEQRTSQTLEIELEDICGGLSVTLLYGVFPELDVITRSAVVKNTGTGNIFLEAAAVGPPAISTIPS